MTSTTTVARRPAAIILLLATILWAVPSSVTLVEQVRYVVGDSPTPDNYLRYQLMWILSSLLALAAVACATVTVARDRLGHLVLAAAVASMAIDLIATVTAYSSYGYSGRTGMLLRTAYITSLNGDFGWRSVVGALSFWLAVPVVIAWLLWITSHRTTADVPAGTPASGAAAPTGLPDSWHVLADGSWHGPYTWQQLSTYAHDGRVAADAMIHRPDGVVVPLRQLLAPRT